MYSNTNLINHLDSAFAADIGQKGWSIIAYPVIQAIGRPDFEDGLRTGTTVEVITDSHIVHTNPEVSVKPMDKCGRFMAVCRGHKT